MSREDLDRALMAAPWRAMAISTRAQATMLEAMAVKAEQTAERIETGEIPAEDVPKLALAPEPGGEQASTMLPGPEMLAMIDILHNREAAGGATDVEGVAVAMAKGRDVVGHMLNALVRTGFAERRGEPGDPWYFATEQGVAALGDPVEAES